MTVQSSLVPNIIGRISRWIDNDHFIIIVSGHEVLGHKNFWNELKNSEISRQQITNTKKKTKGGYKL